VAARSKAWVCDRSLAGIAGSNPTGGHGLLSLVSVVCCQDEVSESEYHSSRGVLPSVVCLSVIVSPLRNVAAWRGATINIIRFSCKVPDVNVLF
jgi:hypothetical protein